MDRRLEEWWRTASLSDQPLFPDVGSVAKPDWDEHRPTTDWARELFDLPEPPRRAIVPQPSDEIQAYLNEKLADAGMLVRQLHDEARARGELHDAGVREVDYQISRTASALEHFRFFSVGYNTSMDMRRAHLERQLATFRRERRALLQKTWQDVTALRREFREAMVEYRALLGRARLL